MDYSGKGEIKCVDRYIRYPMGIGFLMDITKQLSLQLNLGSIFGDNPQKKIEYLLVNTSENEFLQIDINPFDYSRVVFD